MASEPELRAARVRRAEQALGPDRRSWFPPGFRPTEDEWRTRDALLAELAGPPSEAWKPEDELDEDAPRVPMWGRLVARRGPFLVLQACGRRVQAYFPRSVQHGPLGERLRHADLGDHLLVRGRRMRTRTGDRALCCDELVHLGKALRPPPDKWHGLTDVEKRYRERYVDLWVHAEVAAVFRARSAIVGALRRFLDARGFLEVETPVLHPLRGGATARPFRTHHHALDLELYLRIAPELYLKRLLVGGFERVYEIGRCFRNEGISTRHNPEFTMLEAYQAHATHEDLMDLVEAMVCAADRALRESCPQLDVDSARSFVLEPPFPRVALRDAIAERLERAGRDGVPPTPWSDLLRPQDLDDPGAIDDAFARRARQCDEIERRQLAGADGWGARLFLLYELIVEPVLPVLYRTADGHRSLPVFVTGHPTDVSPLARPNDDDPRIVDRFELYLDGREVANAFSELNDPDVQAERFRQQLERRARGDEEAMDYDADFVRALEYGMPPAAGLGVGIDRLVMTLAGQPSIRDVILFPLLRPESR
ncbi:MAG: lysine--tRNA ligase [Myxococcota bacterium]|nr:lysine--tRNA ligase [Myxococcota bacterium]